MHLLHCWTAAFSLYQRTSKAYSETDGEPKSFGIAKLGEHDGLHETDLAVH